MKPAHPAIGRRARGRAAESALLFQWRDNKDNGQFVDGSGKTRSVRLKRRAARGSGRTGKCIFSAVRFVPDGAFNKEIRDACKKSDQIAIEAIVSHVSRSSIWTRPNHQSCRGDPSKRNFTLGQENDRLVLRLQTSNTNRNGMDFKLAPIAGRHARTMCLVTYKPGLLVCYLNGKIASQTKLRKGIFRQMAGQQLFADLWKRSRRRAAMGGLPGWGGHLRPVYRRGRGGEEV